MTWIFASCSKYHKLQNYFPANIAAEIIAVFLRGANKISKKEFSLFLNKECDFNFQLLLCG